MHRSLKLAIATTLLYSLPHTAFADPGVAVISATPSVELVKRGDLAMHKKDYADAVHLYRQAADMGDAVGENSLGWLYMFGLGVPQDYNQSLFWYQKSADQNNALGIHQTAWIYEKGLTGVRDEVKALQLFKKSAALGYADSFSQIGFFYEKGMGGLTQDYAQAIEWYNKGAERNSGFASYHLGNLYDQGLGVTRDESVARGWMTKAARMGEPRAIQWLATHH